MDTARIRHLAVASSVLGAAAALVVPLTASAVTWTTTDTDNTSRAVPSGRAYTTAATLKWQKEAGSQPHEDYRVAWTARLNVAGPRGSCARLRIFTYYTDQDETPRKSYLSKRFPAANTTEFGYYQVCSASGRGSAVKSGSDILTNRLLGASGRKFTRADIRVCYAPSARVPNTSCYAFTVRNGD